MNKKIRNIILGVAVVVLVAGTVKVIPHLTLKAAQVASVEREGIKEVKGSIDIKKGELLVAESATKELHLDTDTLDIRVADKVSGREWTSKVAAPSNNKDKSILTISYLSGDNKKNEWDAFVDVIEPGNYSIDRIEDGVKLTLYFETSTKKPDQLLPSYIESEYLNSRFYDEIEKKAKEGAITDKQAANYKNILKKVYMKDLTKGGFKIVDAKALPPSAVKQLNEMVQIIGYTEEMVKADNEAAGLDIEIPQIASFKIVVDVTLDGEDLVINVPTSECTSGNDYFELQNIEAYATFGHASSEDVKDGYIMVPDGAGALFELNSYNAAYPQYSRPVYDNTYYDQMYQMPTFKEDIHMPVFGMTYGKDENATHGFMGIIESGAELATVNVRLGTNDISTGGSVNNKVYPSVDVMQYSRVKLMGPYSDNDSRYLASTGKIDMDYTVRYKLFNDSVTYFDMANTYKEYLTEKHGLTQNYVTEPKMYIDMLGALTIPARIAGVPYDKTISMTTYEQAQAIVEELSDMNLVLNYEGAFFGGEKTGLQSKASLVKENGSKKEFDALVQAVEASNDQIFFGTDLMTIKDTSYPFSAKVHGLYNYDSKPVAIYDYDYTTGKYSPEFEPTYRMHPKFFGDIVNRFVKGTEGINNISVGDVPNTYYANYKEEEILTPVQANVMIENGLAQLSENKVLAFNNPNMNTLPYCDYAVNISRESSNYGTMYSSIPFRQLVMNGLVEYTTLNVNMSKESKDYYLLQALEVGSYPKFTISATNQDVLKDSQYREYLSVDYNTLKPEMEALYSEYSEAFNTIGTREIKNHRMLEAGAFETEYANGTKVLVNYNPYPVQVEGRTIDAVGYEIIK
ncbi:DUF5696 domain-containing protein [Niameybacter massiliensis]|uniref:DUF5696 domain-containing protein n=1 Tax=Niameybacter massiliensis TaxID=1658108 RepID=UPI0006B5A613|nr:DUF5696 domain-containing protein [Niameybacter massiliensis]